jgi:hypothetical protein
VHVPGAQQRVAPAEGGADPGQHDKPGDPGREEDDVAQPRVLGMPVRAVGSALNGPNRPTSGTSAITVGSTTSASTSTPTTATT